LVGQKALRRHWHVIMDLVIQLVVLQEEDLDNNGSFLNVILTFRLKSINYLLEYIR
jgi:hypothetical protein